MIRMISVLCGGVLAVGAGSVILGEQLAGTASDAVINAQVLTLRAPIDGEVTLNVKALGARLPADETLARIADPRPDEARLVDLQRALAASRADEDRLRDLAETLGRERSKLEIQVRDHGERRLALLEARRARASAATESAASAQREADAVLRRTTALGREGYSAASELSRARTAAETAAGASTAAMEQQRAASIEVEAAARGIYLSDGENDIPASAQRLRELDLRLAEIAAETRATTRRSELLGTQLSEEHVRATRNRSTRLAAPGPTILWQTLASSGEYIRRGNDIVQLIDCNSTMVTASVRESIFNALAVGDRATFLPRGGDAPLEGTVIRLAGAGAATVYSSLAINPGPEHLRRYDVMVSVPGISNDTALSCAVGRTGRLAFGNRPLDGLRRLAAAIFGSV